ncbi:MAG: WxcM-like domain-containing protein, partial [Pseudorhodoplanes sp.]
NLPFIPIRTFIISNVPPGKTRAGHSVSCDLVLTCLVGSCAVALHDPQAPRRELNALEGAGIFVPKRTWLLLENFSPDALLLVHASKHFQKVVYEPHPPDQASDWGE